MLFIYRACPTMDRRLVSTAAAAATTAPRSPAVVVTTAHHRRPPRVPGETPKHTTGLPQEAAIRLPYMITTETAPSTAVGRIEERARKARGRQTGRAPVQVSPAQAGVVEMGAVVTLGGSTSRGIATSQSESSVLPECSYMWANKIWEKDHLADYAAPTT